MTGLIIGITGLLVASFGAFQKSGNLTQKHCYLWGAVLLGVSGYLADSNFYVALELVAIASAIVAFTRLTTKQKSLVPIISAAAAIIWLSDSGELTNNLQAWSALGLIGLSMGFAMNNPGPVLVGAVVISITSFIKWLSPSGSGIDAIFAWLNVVFTISTSIGTYRYMLPGSSRDQPHPGC